MCEVTSYYSSICRLCFTDYTEGCGRQPPSTLTVRNRDRLKTRVNVQRTNSNIHLLDDIIVSVGVESASYCKRKKKEITLPHRPVGPGVRHVFLVPSRLLLVHDGRDVSLQHVGAPPVCEGTAVLVRSDALRALHRFGRISRSGKTPPGRLLKVIHSCTTTHDVGKYHRVNYDTFQCSDSGTITESINDNTVNGNGIQKSKHLNRKFLVDEWGVLFP